MDIASRRSLLGVLVLAGAHASAFAGSILAALTPQEPAAQSSAVLDIAYAEAAPAQQLDLHLPSGTDFATVIFIYGGGWHAGSGKSCTPIAEHLQRAGFACALISHRLAPEHPFPAQIEDVATAFAWVREHIAAEGGDPHRIFLVGHSSGAHLALLLASEPRWLAEHSLVPADIAGVVGMSSPVDLEPRPDGHGFGDALMGGRGADAFGRDVALMRAASPIQHLTKALPRTMLVVGEQDFPMLADDARRFADRAKELGLDVPVEMAAGKDHMGVVASLLADDDPVWKRVLAFLTEQKEAPKSAEKGAITP